MSLSYLYALVRASNWDPYDPIVDTNVREVLSVGWDLVRYINGELEELWSDIHSDEVYNRSAREFREAGFGRAYYREGTGERRELAAALARVRDEVIFELKRIKIHSPWRCTKSFKNYILGQARPIMGR